MLEYHSKGPCTYNDIQLLSIGNATNRSSRFPPSEAHNGRRIPDYPTKNPGRLGDAPIPMKIGR